MSYICEQILHSQSSCPASVYCITQSNIHQIHRSVYYTRKCMYTTDLQFMFSLLGVYSSIAHVKSNTLHIKPKYCSFKCFNFFLMKKAVCTCIHVPSMYMQSIMTVSRIFFFFFFWGGGVHPKQDVNAGSPKHGGEGDTSPPPPDWGSMSWWPSTKNMKNHVFEIYAFSWHLTKEILGNFFFFLGGGGGAYVPFLSMQHLISWSLKYVCKTFFSIVSWN